jgi:hypothetical protein
MKIKKMNEHVMFRKWMCKKLSAIKCPQNQYMKRMVFVCLSLPKGRRERDLPEDILPVDWKASHYVYFFASFLDFLHI